MKTIKPAANNGQIKMVAQMYSDIFAIIINFKHTGDRYVGGRSTTLFGPKR